MVHSQWCVDAGELPPNRGRHKFTAKVNEKEVTAMDDADLAQELEEVLITNAMSARQPGLKSKNGKCIWCEDEPVVADTAFCSADCGEDYVKHQREVQQRR